MNKEELRREEMQEEYLRDKYWEEHKQEFLIKFEGSIYIEALDKDDAISRAQDIPDLSEWVNNWKVEE